MDIKELELEHFEKIKPEAIANWLKVYEINSLKKELLAASSYLVDSGKTYKNYQRFYGNWLRRSASLNQKYDTTTIETFFDNPTDDEWPELLRLAQAKDTEE